MKQKKLTQTQRIAQLESLFVDLTVALQNIANEVGKLQQTLKPTEDGE